jgi:hypothetical protein
VIGVSHAVSHFIIYDRQDAGTIAELGWQERVAACYRWADSLLLGVRDVIHDEAVAWGKDTHTLPPAELQRALNDCESVRAGLLVYDVTCLGEMTRAREVVDRLDTHDLPVHSVRQGPITRESLDADASDAASRGGVG